MPKAKTASAQPMPSDPFAAGRVSQPAPSPIVSEMNRSGGVAISENAIDALLFSSATVMQETRTRLARLNWRWRELATLWDVDRPEDLQRLRQLRGECIRDGLKNGAHE